MLEIFQEPPATWASTWSNWPTSGSISGTPLLAATNLILGAAYTFWMVKRVIFGEVANDNVAELQDINHRERFVLGSMALAVLILGLGSASLVENMDSSIDNL